MSVMGDRIRNKRLENNWSMEELGKRLGVHRAAIGKWENGDVQNIKRSSIEKMARLFDCDPVWLMGFEDAGKVKVTYSAPKKESISATVDHKSKPIIGETALRMRLYQAALSVPAPCLEVAIQLLNSLSNQTQEVFTCSEKCCHLVNGMSATTSAGDTFEVELKNKER